MSKAKTTTLNSASNQRNKVQISFYGTEFDYCAIKSDGILNFGQNYCGMIWNDVYDIELEVNNQSFTDVGKIKVNTLPMQTFDFEKGIAGIRMFENKSQYYCEIETDEDFCIDKLEINLYTCQLKIDSTIAEPYSDTTMFCTIIYNGIEYPLSCGVSDCKGSDLVWGYRSYDVEDTKKNNKAVGRYFGVCSRAKPDTYRRYYAYIFCHSRRYSRWCKRRTWCCI